MTQPQIKTRAEIQEEIIDAYYRLTENATAQVDISIEVRRALREMLHAWDDDLTVADLREHLEEYWS
ncbi:hypothetical protein CGLAMM_03735 [Acetobacteraceae bacterium EV16G]|uniref:Uncharacterized protein n=1 Tax=Sorlinia euscelidii TaxID=3081148 RepID=A0ABU7TZW7_9PROT